MALSRGAQPWEAPVPAAVWVEARQCWGAGSQPVQRDFWESTTVLGGLIGARWGSWSPRVCLAGDAHDPVHPQLAAAGDGEVAGDVRY